MNWLKFSLCGLVAAGAICMVGAAEDSTPARLKSDQTQSLVTLLVRETKLTPDQEAKVREKQAAMFKTLAQWDKTHELQFTRLDAEIVAASSSGKTQEMEDLTKERNDLKQQRIDRAASLMNDLMNVLTPEQKLMWDGYKMFPEILAKFKTLTLTEEQYAKIREMCTAAAQQEAILRKKEEPTAPVRENLIVDIKRNVLTPWQMDKMVGATQLTQGPTTQPKAPIIVGVNSDPIRDMAGNGNTTNTPAPIVIGGTGHHRNYRRR